MPNSNDNQVIQAEIHAPILELKSKTDYQDVKPKSKLNKSFDNFQSPPRKKINVMPKNTYEKQLGMVYFLFEEDI